MRRIGLVYKHQNANGDQVVPRVVNAVPEGYEDTGRKNDKGQRIFRRQTTSPASSTPESNTPKSNIPSTNTPPTNPQPKVNTGQTVNKTRPQQGKPGTNTTPTRTPPKVTPPKDKPKEETYDEVILDEIKPEPKQNDWGMGIGWAGERKISPEKSNVPPIVDPQTGANYKVYAYDIPAVWDAKTNTWNTAGGYNQNQTIYSYVDNTGKINYFDAPSSVNAYDDKLKGYSTTSVKPYQFGTKPNETANVMKYGPLKVDGATALDLNNLGVKYNPNKDSVHQVNQANTGAKPVLANTIGEQNLPSSGVFEYQEKAKTYTTQPTSKLNITNNKIGGILNKSTPIQFKRSGGLVFKHQEANGDKVVPKENLINKTINNDKPRQVSKIPEGYIKTDRFTDEGDQIWEFTLPKVPLLSNNTNGSIKDEVFTKGITFPKGPKDPPEDDDDEPEDPPKKRKKSKIDLDFDLKLKLKRFGRTIKKELGLGNNKMKGCVGVNCFKWKKGGVLKTKEKSCMCGGPLYKKKSGGTIHINPENKGKFTASAKKAGMGVQEFASHVLANKGDYNTTQVKRANFAKNASKWKH